MHEKKLEHKRNVNYSRQERNEQSHKSESGFTGELKYHCMELTLVMGSSGQAVDKIKTLTSLVGTQTNSRHSN